MISDVHIPFTRALAAGLGRRVAGRRAERSCSFSAASRRASRSPEKPTANRKGRRLPAPCQGSKKRRNSNRAEKKRLLEELPGVPVGGEESEEGPPLETEPPQESELPAPAPERRTDCRSPAVTG